ncbi:IS66 family transposase [Clostridium botulinum]|uniref:IS66 family transposase n=1 Tax=Clostridium botulinum TaxID=1491 RepID=UPI001E2BB8DB|nr:transposase [Clostridium botulinum]MCC5422401.1 transposase [Clostridium botulinum]
MKIRGVILHFILYDYKPSKADSNAANYLKGFKGYLHTYAYIRYEKVEGVIICECWSQLRRYLVEAIPTNVSNDGKFSNVKSVGTVVINPKYM